MHQPDVLVIGSGLAGCTAALIAAQGGAQVLLINRSHHLESSNTAHAQGGIIFRGKGDSKDLLAHDIEEAGAGLCNSAAVKVLAEEGPRLVDEVLIKKLKVPFDRAGGGELDLTEEGAHSLPRIIHAADLTGKAIEDACVAAVRQTKNIKILQAATAVDLLTLSHHSLDPRDAYAPLTCIGAYVLLRDEQKVVPILAKETILATGGLGQLYLHSTNPRGARGDGIAMAYRAGARLINLEFIQFHPTALYHPAAERFLISESMRGEGAILRRRTGEEFMGKYHPQGSLAPRDVVARAIHEEMLAQDDPFVLLDITHKDPAWIRSRFPNIYTKCLSLGLDITSQPIPVVPAAHYSCGGVAVDLEGRTSLQRLWAVGEVSCTGLHGANRLASTSLLEGLVWGHRAGRAILDRLAREKYYMPEIAEWIHERELIDPALILQDWLSLKYTMWNYVGLVRTTKRLKRARQILRELQLEVESFYERALLTDEVLGLRNGIQAGLAVLYAATENHRSVGCHYRKD